MFTLQKKNNKGFTLIEMLVAVFIFSVALSALMSVAARGLKASRLAQDQVVADYLALEGIEIIRNIRDAAFLSQSNSNTWTDVFSQNDCLEDLESTAASSCAFEFGDPINLYPCSGSNLCDLYFNDSLGVYANFQNTIPAGYINSKYDRTIYFEQTGTGNEVIVTVNVSWDRGSVEYVESLFLWL